MPNSLASPRLDRLRNRLDEVHPTMAKAVKKVDESPWRERIASAIARCFALAGVSQKEAAALLERDQAQVARWIAGAERPQLDAIFSVELFRRPIVQALAELAGTGVQIETTIRIHRAV